ncbi:MAG: hypothetical protein FWJ61_11125 [Limnochordales bacterium]
MGSWLGAALILVAAGAAGFVVAGSYSQRPAILAGLQTALTMLHTEIVYGATPLPEALERVGRRTAPAVAPFFAEAAALLARRRPLPAPEAWRRALLSQRRRWCLTAADEEALLDLAPYLGRTSAADQERHLRLALARLARQQQEAEAEAAVQARLWRWLGVCVGGLLVIALA